MALLAPLALLLLSASGPSPAQASSRPHPMSITISGGASLGAYEAGALYYALETAKVNPRHVELKLVTGASAGAINGLLAILSACGPRVDHPRDSLLWQTWLPLGFDALFIRSEASKLSALSVEGVQAAVGRIEEAWGKGLSTDCDVVLGITVTRVVAQTVRTAGGRLTLDHTEEKVAVRIRGRGLGRLPSLRNYADSEDPLEGLMLVTDQEGEIAFNDLRSLILASAALPLAFAPQPLRHCDAHALPKTDVCLASEARTDIFVDGGLLDNTPLRFATRLARAGLGEGPGGAVAWRDRPSTVNSKVPKDMFISFFTPDVADYPISEFAPRMDAEHSLVTLVTRLFGGFVTTARSKELITLVEEEPDLADRTLVLRRHAPAASAPMAAFFGFFDRELRAFDFYLGMYDAWNMLQGSSHVHLESFQPTSTGSVPEWQAFECIREVLETGPKGSTKQDWALPQACAGDALGGERILLQASLERLYQDCSAVAPRIRSGRDVTSNSWCRDAVAGGEPPVFKGVSPLEPGGWRRRDGENETAYTMRLLGAHRFALRDLGLTADEAPLALPRIRERVGLVVDRVSELQPSDDRELVTFAGRAVVNSISYAPPRTLLYLTMGPEFELGFSGWYAPVREKNVPWVRLNAAAQVRGVDELLSSGGDLWSLALAGGLELQPPRLSSLTTQVSFGLRGGYLLSSGDRLASTRCPDRDRGRFGGCSRPEAEGHIALTTLERLRLQVAVEWLPPADGAAGLWAVAPGLGIEFPF